MKKFLIPFCCLICSCSVSAQLQRATGERKSITHDGRERAYRIHVPKSAQSSKKRVTLVFCFHGGGGNAEQASKMGWTRIADREGFIVVYPEGLNRHWNDGRESRKFAEQDAKIDDVAFVLKLLDHIEKEYRIDPSRIYVTGASNGGFFSQRMAIEGSDRFAAAGILIATMPKPFVTGKKKFSPAEPISILMMNGTEDPFVPYQGGPITPNFTPRLAVRPGRRNDRGECSSTGKAVELWLAHNGLSQTKPVIETLPDKDPGDGCRVEKSTWSGGKNGTSVVLYRVEGGGHTWPGGSQYLPERIIGKTCRDFDGLPAIWEFFKAHPKQ